MGQCEYKKFVATYLFRNGGHELFLRKSNKLALNSYHDKRKYI